MLKSTNFAYHAKFCMQSTKKKVKEKEENKCMCLKLQGYQVLHSFNNVNFTSGDARVTRTNTHA